MTVLLALPLSAEAAVEDTHFFDAGLSLTGDCSVSGADPIPDPGCPGGEHPPAGPLSQPFSVATDPTGNIYVVSSAFLSGSDDARVDVFSPSGNYLTGIEAVGAKYVAVDAGGHVYLSIGRPGDPDALVRFDPTEYEPQTGNIAYGSPPVDIPNSGTGLGIAVNPANQHLFVSNNVRIREFGPAVDGEPNEELAGTIGEGVLESSNWVTVDGARNRLYAPSVDQTVSPSQTTIKVFEASAPYALVDTIDPSTTPTGRILSNSEASVAAEEENGHLFVSDIPSARKVYEFDAEGNYVATLLKPRMEGQGIAIGVDNSEESPNHRYLFVPSGETVPGHLYAFEPKFEPKPPQVESTSVGGVSDEEAVLRATINPEGSPTHYALEYVTQQSFEAEGFAGAVIVGEGEIPAGSEGVEVSGPATGLEPGTAYRFRARAENQCQEGGCVDEAQTGFTTFGSYAQSGACPNQAIRTGASAALPDCRAYELLTPVDTNGRPPVAIGNNGATNRFGSPTVSPQGDAVGWLVLGGVIPGFDGAGGFDGDGYLSTRAPDGWQTASAGPTGEQAVAPIAGGVSPDQRYMLWDTSIHGGSLMVEGKSASYIRYPDGSFHLVGQGSLGADRNARVAYIAESAAHIVFLTQNIGSAPVKLEPDAPPDGTAAIYDRTSDGANHVISLLPGDVTPAAGENASYQGASADGSAVAFKIGNAGPLYLRVENAETLVAAPPGATVAGLSADGRYLFYLQGGDLHRFDAQSEARTQLTETADATVVNVPASGGGAYFLSPSVLGEEPNPNGAEPELGAQNLYLWDGAIRFVATVTERDAKGEFTSGGFQTDGLGLWAATVANGETVLDPSRTSPDGKALIFESRAELTGYDSGGYAQIYRYDAGADTLTCLSCNPTLASAGSDASLASIAQKGAPLYKYSLVANMSPDGRRAFFESSEQLVLADNDGLRDVYEWEANGKGSCATPGGCLFLVSSGASARPNYLFGVSASGEDVFIQTSDRLLPQDTDETPSIYDARVNGGFPPPRAPAGECLGEACQPPAVAPDDSTPASASFVGAGNVLPETKRPHCRKGKRAVRRGGKVRCVARAKKPEPKRNSAHRRAAR